MLLSVKVSIIVTTKWERFKVMEILLDNGRFNLFTYRREVLFASLFDSKRYTEKVEGNTDLDRCWIAEGKIKGYNTEILFRPDANYLLLDTPQLSNEDYFNSIKDTFFSAYFNNGICFIDKSTNKRIHEQRKR